METVKAYALTTSYSEVDTNWFYHDVQKTKPLNDSDGRFKWLFCIIIISLNITHFLKVLVTKQVLRKEFRSRPIER